jgi:hypothetical protein
VSVATGTVRAIFLILLLTGSVLAQAPITLTISTSAHEFAIPADFVGLGFETRSVVANSYGVQGNFFSPANTQLITLFRNIGIKQIRVGGGTVDDSGESEHCVAPTPTYKDIDNLFEFAHATGIKVIYSVRLENPASCANLHLAEDDAKIIQYIWSKYRANLDSFSIGNEPDVGGYHPRPGQPADPAIYETTPGDPGSAYPSYIADWRHFADVIRKAVPDAKFSGPDTAVSSRSSFTPNPVDGVSWTIQFAKDLKGSGLLIEALQHHYVWGRPENTTAREAIDDMLSSAWDDDITIGSQPAFNGGTAKFRVLKPGGLFFCRLASSIGMERQVKRRKGRRFLLPDGSERYLVDEALLVTLTEELGGQLMDPLKTTVVQNQRCMTTWIVRKDV